MRGPSKYEGFGQGHGSSNFSLVMPTNTAKIFLFLMAAGCWKQNSVKIFPLAQILAVKDATPVERRTNEGSDASNNPNHGSWLDKPKNGYIHAVKRLSSTTKPYFVFWVGRLD
ncbi:hypothetical protein A7D00_1262 [Trichophyton violaceum]|uniref:Uncharacterized protein n=1 Tax=Trichophyton violaceum TaxID=34388 RepID=A0A178FT82_TRIVO|nr:hypothetical protein A7D00_1262 [Trichophyton violaceum]